MSMRDTINDYVVTAFTRVNTSLDPEFGNPVEAYTLTYTNGRDLIMLYAAQWATEGEQEAALPMLTASLKNTGNVDEMPSWIQDFPTAQTASREVWGNKTAAFAVVGPSEDVIRFQQAFPM